MIVMEQVIVRAEFKVALHIRGIAVGRLMEIKATGNTRGSER
jgi:hypothetical protein